ncbi:MAG: restriction endonuclease subunit R [Anaerolinea sp.]|nr:restriction endonuclease subunit R [Anaerolinea sp.]
MQKRTSQPRLLDVQARPIKFDQKLVLNQWLLSLFEVKDLSKLQEFLKDPAYEGFDENNISHYCHVLCARLFDRKELPRDLLLAYDQNIVRYWKRITEHRNRSGNLLHPKYFQYLALLFTEIYLDRYFSNPGKLLSDINQQVEKFNDGKAEANKVELYRFEELNKIAFWMATGSGKTLLMHINILQYQHYLGLHNHHQSINRIILLTPNDGLSRQHLAEFELSGIQAELFVKEGRSLFSGRSVEIIDIHKLREESGEKTIAVEAFEGNNLVLVDEGHRGTSGKETGEWMKRREQLCENGFSFEYSATFGQAMKASGNRSLEQTYAHCILFDYSYKYFYGDGYGKEYRILNLGDDSDEAKRKRYLIACLLAFYQQMRLYADKKVEYRPYLLENPLWIFVGGSVKAVRSENKRKVSDVVDILLFLAEFTSAANRSENIRYIEAFLKGQSGLLDTHGNDLFSSAFTYLVTCGLSAEQVFADVLRVIFNADAPSSMHVILLKGADGEIALRLGDQDGFGLINVGDAADLCKSCEVHKELVVSDQEFSGSLFQSLNDPQSKINILIGSKKFTEGWNSWRVSTMGLMNIGRTEGSEIIQLFGRGVRLKGKDFCLKRSRRIDENSAPKDMERLETLNIFGIRADYMRQFKDYLEEEGLPSNEDRIDFVLPVINGLGQLKLKTVHLKEGVDFKHQGPCPTLDQPDDLLRRQKVILDWYPKIQALASEHGQGPLQEAQQNQSVLTQTHIAFLNLDAIYFELQRFKNERAWFNLNLSHEKILKLLQNPGWYELYIPKDVLEFHSFDQVNQWQEIAIALLKKYCDRFYKYHKAAWENDHLEYSELSTSDTNFFTEYHIMVERSKDDIIKKLGDIKALIETKKLQDIEYQGMLSIMFDRHLYQPLIYVANNFLEVKPVALNEGERDFVQDLKGFYEANKAFFEGNELYLLRNMSRGRGIGFFEAGNFYPDFILWLVVGSQQRIIFVDPKGIRNLEGMNDPKIKFHQEIKQLEVRLGDSNVKLESFIISNTPYTSVAWWEKGITREEFEAHHVLFQVEDKTGYIKKMLI